MNIHQFKKLFSGQIFISGAEIRARSPEMQANNLSRWTRKGYLVRLKRDLYLMPEYREIPGLQWLAANRLYRPSYISLFSALAYYGLIPEAVPYVHSISAMKSIRFRTEIGSFFYRKLKPQLFFGYDRLHMKNGHSMLIASPEKALLDIFYLEPVFDDADEIAGLRLDKDLILELIDLDKLMHLAPSFESKALSRRVENFIEWMEI